jgi:NAD(P)-dependent dehydrogenase (short-subunit alcohol dehydrogenase family)
MFRLDRKVAAITGGGSGIGKAVCKLFAKQGAVVHILDLSAQSANDVSAEINADGGQSFVHAVDVSNQQQVTEVFNEIAGLNILVNNAGIAHVGNVENTTEADFDKIYNVNVKGAYNCLHAAVPLMKANGGGAIVSLASIAALVGIPDRFACLLPGIIYMQMLGAILSRRQECIRLLLMVLLQKTTRAKSRKCLRSCQNLNQSEEWAMLKKLQTLFYTWLLMKPHLLPAMIFLLMAVLLS